MVAPGNLEPIGVQAIWQDAGFNKGSEDYNRQLLANSQATKQYTRLTAIATTKSAQQWQRSQKTIRGEMQQSEKQTRKYIAGIAGIYAMFRMAPQIASQFGMAIRDAVAGQAMREGFRTMSDDAGVAFDSLLADMQRAARGTVSEIELIRGVNRGLLVEGARFAEAMPRLMEIARSAALATGQDLIFVFDSLTKGIARASYRLIDNAEIYLRIGPVVERYAEAQGKAVDELEFTERQMVILNEVLKQGEDLVGLYGDTAVDAFDRASASVQDLKQDFLELAAVIPGAPEATAIAQVANELAPLAQTIALLSIAGVSRQGILSAIFGRLPAGVAAAGLAAVGGALSGIAVAFVAYNEAVRDSALVTEVFGKTLPSTGRTLDMLSTIVQRQVRSWVQGQEAADEWFREVEGMTTVADLWVEAHREMAEASRMFLDSLDIQRLETFIDAELEAGRVASAMLAASELLTKRSEQQRIEEEKNAKLTEQLLRRFKERSEEALDAWEDFIDAREDLAAKEEEIDREIERDAEDHGNKLAAIARQAAFDRAKAWRDYQDDILRAERSRQRAIEDAAYRHNRRLQDIEFDHQRTLLEIEERYQKSVREGAIERDALAILRARERRGEEITQAQRDRQDNIRSEQRNFEDSLRQAERAYQDRLWSARRAYDEELRELEFRLQERLRKENENYRLRLQRQKLANAEELAEEVDQTEALRLEWQRRQRLRDRVLRRLYPPEETAWPYNVPGISGDEGFSGVVTGPTSLNVGAGVTEYIYASGNIGGGRQPVLPSAAQTQSSAMRAAVSGAVGVGLQGFNQGLMGRIGPELQDMVGQAVVDEITAAILAG